MTHVASISTPEGTTATVDFDKLKAFSRRALGALGEAEAAQQEFKDIVLEAVTETGLKKTVLSKYFKERYAVKTKATRQTGELFGQLDDGLDGPRKEEDDE